MQFASSKEYCWIQKRDINSQENLNLKKQATTHGKRSKMLFKTVQQQRDQETEKAKPLAYKCHLHRI